MKQEKYVVYMVHYHGNALPPKFETTDITPTNYIGSTSLSKIKNGYMGSVSSIRYGSIWHSEVKSNTDLFTISIIREFETKREALFLESNLHKCLNVISDPLFVNMSHAGEYNNWFLSGVDNHNFGKKRPEQSEKFKKNNPNKDGHTFKGKNHSDETKKKMSEIQKARPEVICPHCGLVGRGNTMLSHHFDNCNKHPTPKLKTPVRKVSCIECRKEYDPGNFTKHLKNYHLTSEVMSE